MQFVRQKLDTGMMQFVRQKLDTGMMQFVRQKIDARMMQFVRRNHDTIRMQLVRPKLLPYRYNSKIVSQCYFSSPFIEVTLWFECKMSLGSVSVGAWPLLKKSTPSFLPTGKVVAPLFKTKNSSRPFFLKRKFIKVLARLFFRMKKWMPPQCRRQWSLRPASMCTKKVGAPSFIREKKSVPPTSFY